MNLKIRSHVFSFVTSERIADMLTVVVAVVVVAVDVVVVASVGVDWRLQVAVGRCRLQMAGGRCRWQEEQEVAGKAS